jgi:hypothetical protein
MKARQNQTDPFRLFVEVIVSGDIAAAIRLLDASPHLTRERTARGATRHTAKENFFDRIKHYISEGDTALHVAAAAKQTRIAKELIARGADVRAKNRRGAEPLHYAVDGGPGSPVWNPNEQIAIIAELIRAGADPNAFDKSGVAPLHRAVRNRCAAAVRSLIEGGADPKAPNRNGSTPMLLATLNTGKADQDLQPRRSSSKRFCAFLRRTVPDSRCGPPTSGG